MSAAETPKGERSAEGVSETPAPGSDQTPAAAREVPRTPNSAKVGKPKPPAKEIGGRDGPDPTRYGDWEVNGICVDF